MNNNVGNNYESVSKDFKSGFVSIVGIPNVGKSTLMNALVGDKIAITSVKPQTTRNKIRGILTGEGFQAVFIDTPGIHAPKNKLGEYMQKSAESTINDADVVLFVVEPSTRDLTGNEAIIEKLKAEKQKNDDLSVLLIINKTDTVEKSRLLGLIDMYGKLMDFDEIIPVSAVRAENLDVLIGKIKHYLPVGPEYFPGDCITDQPERQICAEIIREKILFLMQDEIPHGVAVEIMSMKKRDDKNLMDIDATIYCEKDSHKGMIIGKKGQKLKEIGMRARPDIERFLGTPVYLRLWLKVKQDWRDNDFLLRNFGYN